VYCASPIQLSSRNHASPAASLRKKAERESSAQNNTMKVIADEENEDGRGDIFGEKRVETGSSP
jgi:hypothetical protein